MVFALVGYDLAWEASPGGVRMIEERGPPGPRVLRGGLFGRPFCFQERVERSLTMRSKRSRAARASTDRTPASGPAEAGA